MTTYYTWIALQSLYDLSGVKSAHPTWELASMGNMSLCSAYVFIVCQSAFKLMYVLML